MISLVMMCLMNIDDSYTAVVPDAFKSDSLRFMNTKTALSTVIYYTLNKKVQNINTKQASVTAKKNRKISGCPMYPSSYCMQTASTLTLQIQNKNITPLNLCRFRGKII